MVILRLVTIIELIKEYLAKGNYYWNAGLFFFTGHTMKFAFRKYSPNILENCEKLNNKFVNGVLKLENDKFIKCRSESVDYAVMEYIDNGIWSDIGSWSSLFDYLKGTSGRTNNILQRTRKYLHA